MEERGERLESRAAECRARAIGCCGGGTRTGGDGDGGPWRHVSEARLDESAVCLRQGALFIVAVRARTSTSGTPYRLGWARAMRCCTGSSGECRQWLVARGSDC